MAAEPITAPPRPPVDRATLDALQARAEQTLAKLAGKTTIEEIVGPEGLANASPFYFQLLGGVAQLKAARLAAGLTLADVAGRADVSEAALADLETGRTVNPSWQLLGKYAVAVGLTLRLTAE